MRENYIKDIDTFLFRRSWGILFQNLSDEDAGKIIKALYRYADGEDTPLEEFGNQTLASIYSMLSGQLNYSAKKFTERVERYRAEREQGLKKQ